MCISFSVFSPLGDLFVSVTDTFFCQVINRLQIQYIFYLFIDSCFVHRLTHLVYLLLGSEQHRGHGRGWWCEYIPTCVCIHTTSHYLCPYPYILYLCIYTCVPILVPFSTPQYVCSFSCAFVLTPVQELIFQYYTLVPVLISQYLWQHPTTRVLSRATSWREVTCISVCKKLHIAWVRERKIYYVWLISWLCVCWYACQQLTQLIIFPCVFDVCGN